MHYLPSSIYVFGKLLSMSPIQLPPPHHVCPIFYDIENTLSRRCPRSFISDTIKLDIAKNSFYFFKKLIGSHFKFEMKLYFYFASQKWVENSSSFCKLGLFYISTKLNWALVPSPKYQAWIEAQCLCIN